VKVYFNLLLILNLILASNTSLFAMDGPEDNDPKTSVPRKKLSTEEDKQRKYEIKLKELATYEFLRTLVSGSDTKESIHKRESVSPPREERPNRNPELQHNPEKEKRTYRVGE